MFASRTIRKIDNESSKEELETCMHFLVAFELENDSNKYYNFARNTWDWHVFSQKLKAVCEKIKSAEKWKVAFRFPVKNVEQRVVCTGTRKSFGGQKNLLVIKIVSVELILSTRAQTNELKRKRTSTIIPSLRLLLCAQRLPQYVRTKCFQNNLRKTTLLFA